MSAQLVMWARGWLSRKEAGVQISPGDKMFFLFFSQRSKGQGNDNAKFMRLKSEMVSGLQSFLSFEGKGNYNPLPLSSVSVGNMLLFRGQGQWLLYLKYLAGVKISLGHIIFNFSQKNKGQDKGNAKFMRLKSEMAGSGRKRLQCTVKYLY